MLQAIFSIPIKFLIAIPTVFSQIYPTIIKSPGDITIGNDRVNLKVKFVSDYLNETEVTWYKNGMQLPIGSSVEIYGRDNEAGSTMLIFDPARRTDTGNYVVELYNKRIQPASRRSVRTEPFLVAVRVLPESPTNFQLRIINATTILIQWTLPIISSPDAIFDELVLKVTNYSQPIIQLPLTTTEIYIRTEPAVVHTANITSHNSDGNRTSETITVLNIPREPAVTDILILRVDPTTFNVTVLVEYTGAGPSANLSLITIECRDILGDMTRWLYLSHSIPLINDTVSKLKWHAVIMNEALATLERVEFKFGIINSIYNLFITSTVEGLSVLPGQPVIMSGYTTTKSLYITSRLSREGTSPLITFNTVISAPGFPIHSYTKDINKVGGEEVDEVITNLSPNVAYTVYIYVSNEVGLSPQSPSREFTTEMPEKSLEMPTGIKSEPSSSTSSPILQSVLYLFSFFTVCMTTRLDCL